jgi:hypothetical protein
MISEPTVTTEETLRELSKVLKNCYDDDDNDDDDELYFLCIFSY